LAINVECDGRLADIANDWSCQARDHTRDA
jgi:hypothetical protein